MHVRGRCVEYMCEHRDALDMYFDGDADFERYTSTMARAGTWGDELTLKVRSYRETWNRRGLFALWMVPTIVHHSPTICKRKRKDLPELCFKKRYGIILSAYTTPSNSTGSMQLVSPDAAGMPPPLFSDLVVDLLTSLRGGTNGYIASASISLYRLSFALEYAYSE